MFAPYKVVALVALVASALLVGAGCSPAAPADLHTSPLVAPSPTSSTSPSNPSSPAAATASPGPATFAVRPGESWVAYDSYQEGKDTRDLFLARPDGSDAHPIATDVPGDHREPAWSPDGSRIAFQNQVSATTNWEIWAASADGSAAKVLFDGAGACPGGVNHPSWSPNGSKLAITCYPSDHKASLVTLDLASMTLTSIVTVTWPEFLDNNARWSPDGKSIVFDILHWDPTDDHLDGSLIAVVPAAGGPVKRLTKFDAFMAHPDWRPDGNEIVMNSYDLGNIHTIDHPSNLYLMKPDGTGLRQLTHSSTDGRLRIGEPRWTPDGKRVAVAVGTSTPPNTTIDNARIAFVDASGGEPVFLQVSGGAHPDVRP